MERMNGLLAVGVVLIVAGLLGFAIPVFTTRSTETVARIGDLKKFKVPKIHPIAFRRF